LLTDALNSSASVQPDLSEAGAALRAAVALMSQAPR
jgi:hypothetical protein